MLTFSSVPSGREWASSHVYRSNDLALALSRTDLYLAKSNGVHIMGEKNISSDILLVGPNIDRLLIVWKKLKKLMCLR